MQASATRSAIEQSNDPVVVVAETDAEADDASAWIKSFGRANVTIVLIKSGPTSTDILVEGVKGP